MKRPAAVPVNHEPDYRFSLANERTFLAWIRTALALDATGVAAAYILSPSSIAKLVGVGLVGLGILLATTSLFQWRANQRAMQRDAPLPRSPLPIMLGLALTVLSLAAAAMLLAGSGMVQ